MAKKTKDAFYVTSTELKNNMGEILFDSAQTNKPVIITKFGKPCYIINKIVTEADNQTENIVYIEDITGTLGNWLDDNLDKDIPQNVIDAINNAYVLATNCLCNKE